jgi:hypothetical protein
VSSDGMEPGAACLSYLVWTLWLQGYPDQALARSQEALRIVSVVRPYSSWRRLLPGSARALTPQTCGPPGHYSQNLPDIFLTYPSPHEVRYAAQADNLGW